MARRGRPVIVRAARAVARFWAGFLVGDDPVPAVIVAVALAASWALAAGGLPAWWLLPAAAVLAIALTVRRGVRRGRRIVTKR
jgi:hypothetical protein